MYVRNCEVRDRFVQAYGEQRFEEECANSERLKMYQEIPIPDCYQWVWGHFIAIWQQCEFDFNGNRIFTYGTVNDYVECMKVPLKISDKRLLFKIKHWALEQISEMSEK